MNKLPGILDDYRTNDGNLPAYAWPGGYAIAYVVDDSELLCSECVNDETNPVHVGGNADGWRVEGFMTADLHESGEDWTCAHCNKVIDPN